MRTCNWKRRTTLFNNGDADQGQADIRKWWTMRAKVPTRPSSSGKHLKDTEIKLRKLAERMHDIGESLAFEDRAAGTPGGG